MIAGLIIVVIMMGIIFVIIAGLSAANAASIARHNKDSLKDDDDYVKLIDSQLGSVVGIQHEWTKTHWHILNKGEKLAWVKRHQRNLSSIADSRGPIDTIRVMQDAEYQASSSPVTGTIKSDMASQLPVTGAQTNPPLAPNLQTQPGIATIILRRSTEWYSRFRAYNVLLDGKDVGDIKCNQEITLVTTHGEHNMQIKIDWTKSNIYNFRINNMQPKIIACGGNLMGSLHVSAVD